MALLSRTPRLAALHPAQSLSFQGAALLGRYLFDAAAADRSALERQARHRLKHFESRAFGFIRLPCHMLAMPPTDVVEISLANAEAMEKTGFPDDTSLYSPP